MGEVGVTGAARALTRCEVECGAPFRNLISEGDAPARFDMECPFIECFLCVVSLSCGTRKLPLSPPLMYM